MKKLNEIKETLESHLVGINGTSVLRNKAMDSMKTTIESSRARAIIAGEVTINELTENEIIVLFRAIFNTLKDNDFNPENFMLESTKKRKARREPRDPNEKVQYFAVEDERVYHPKLKDKFLSEHLTEKGEHYAEETKRVAIALFGNIGHIEERYNKDVYNFNSNQFEELLLELKATTLRSLQNSISKLEQYIDFLIENGKVSKEKGNIATKYNNGDVIKNFLDTKAIEGMVFAKAEIDAMSMSANNAQDGVILSLLFDGVSHKRKFIELRSITINHCDFEQMVINIPQLVDEDTGEVLPARQVPISSNTERMIRNAMTESKYVSLKGQASRAYTIADSDFILRGLRNNPQIKWENVGQRIVRISEVLNYPYLNATNVAYSGQIHYARELIKEGLSIDEACAQMLKRFNLSDNESAHFYLKARIEKANQNPVKNKGI